MIFQAVELARMESCPTQAVLPLVELAADKITRDGILRAGRAAGPVGRHFGATTGTNRADPSHDAAGNMTSLPKPSDLGNSISAEYDAWNRLVEVTDGGVLVAKFRYDGEGRRISSPVWKSL